MSTHIHCYESVLVAASIRVMLGCLACQALALPARSENITIQDTVFHHRKECNVVAPSSSFTCEYTMTTVAEGFLNVHFSKDKTGSESISFVASVRQVKYEKSGALRLYFPGFFIRNPRVSQIDASGTCVLDSNMFRCTTSDGKYSAAASD